MSAMIEDIINAPVDSAWIAPAVLPLSNAKEGLRSQTGRRGRQTAILSSRRTGPSRTAAMSRPAASSETGSSVVPSTSAR